MQFKGKLILQTSENGEKRNFGPNFSPFSSIFSPQFFFHGSYFYQMLGIATSYRSIQFEGKRMIQTQENGKKTLFWGSFWYVRLKFRLPKIFFKNLASSVSRYDGQLLSCTMPEKTNDPIFIELSYGRTYKQTDRQTDETGFIGQTSSVQ